MSATRPAVSSRLTSARRSDLDQIMEIETLCFSAPWSRQVFLEEFDREFAYLKVIRREPDGLVVAFVNYWVVQDEVHVLNVATHPSWRRQGLGRKMMNHVLRAARMRSARLITLEVRRSNRPAIELYRSLGFDSVGVRPRYYENLEDAIVMLKRLRGNADE